MATNFQKKAPNMSSVTELWGFHIYRAQDLYEREGTEVAKRYFDLDDWKAEIHLGAIPPPIVDAIAAGDAWLDTMFGNPTAESITSAIRNYTLPENWRDPRGLYITTIIKKTINIDADPKRRDAPILWFDLNQAERLADNNRTQRDKLLERLLWLILECFGPRMVYESFIPNRWAIVRQGRIPSPITYSMAGRGIARHVRQVSYLNHGLAKLQSSNSAPSKDKTGIIGISRFAVEVERETDDFKCFLWCYSGLEIISNKLYSRLKGDVHSALLFTYGDSQHLSGDILNELIWPVPDDAGKEPGRSIVHKFTLVALALSPTTATSDVTDFKRINKYRNGIHGNLDFTEVPPLDAARSLFRRYSALALDLLRTT
ncbi:hypothetical protein [Actinomadura sp. GTD37]|uniref:hypothetical protein n=1 Tax=Actinomadura sp. GTD37 TaxID=1778030 RepID=UPI0035C1816E